jgi:hypothetical protein
LGSDTGGDPNHILSGRSFAINVLQNNEDGPAINTLILPLTADDPVDPTDASTLSGGNVLTLQNSEWFCERLVGKLFIGVSNEVTAAPAVLVGAGFFVARANDGESGGGVNTPIGSASLGERNSNYSPLHGDAIREPWMWRRTWVLGGPFVPAEGLSGNPSTNTFYGSVADGPHIDVKSVRRIRGDERLWFAISTASIVAGSTQLSASLRGYLDLRILGALRKPQNRGAF